MFFRTRQSSGLLAYLGPTFGTGQRTYLRVDLQDGLVVVSYSLNPIVTPTDRLVMDATQCDDGKQHFLSVCSICTFILTTSLEIMRDGEDFSDKLTCF